MVFTFLLLKRMMQTLITDIPQPKECQLMHESGVSPTEFMDQGEGEKKRSHGVQRAGVKKPWYPPFE